MCDVALRSVILRCERCYVYRELYASCASLMEVCGCAGRIGRRVSREGEFPVSLTRRWCCPAKEKAGLESASATAALLALPTPSPPTAFPLMVSNVLFFFL